MSFDDQEQLNKRLQLIKSKGIERGRRVKIENDPHVRLVRSVSLVIGYVSVFGVTGTVHPGIIEMVND